MRKRKERKQSEGGVEREEEEEEDSCESLPLVFLLFSLRHSSPAFVS